ncbi:MAG: hypothetical protein EOM26_14075 [Alphaproteobacteria bacterium]|nr:hypothetical protein [Alphaproteobacteria bacterium]
MNASPMIPVELNNEVVSYARFDDFTTEHECFPTSRSLNGSRDHGWDQEWAADGTIFHDGEHVDARMIFLFDEDDVENEDASEWPWEDRAARIVIS